MIVSSVKNKDLIIGYRCFNKLDKIIKTHKDKNEHSCNSNVVYRINCNDCNASYVGQTKRQLQTRLIEHKNNIKLDSIRHSVISEHILNKQHTFDWNNVKILDSEINYHKRLISEMLYIKEQKNGLNLNKDTELLSESYFDILDIIANI
jgi:tetrahydrodipicolinate N-succinyltransferase